MASVTAQPIVPERLELQEPDADDWLKPSCNHVIVNFAKQKEAIDKSSKQVGKGRKSLHEPSSYCVMCGESISDSEPVTGNKKQDANNGSKFPSDKRNTAKTETDMKVEANFTPRLDSKRQIFASTRRSGSTLSMSAIARNGIPCAMHSHKKIKCYCEDHQEICCSVCVNVLHPKCERVMLIKDELTSCWDSNTTNETVEILKSIRASFEEVVERNESVIDKLEKQRKQAKSRREALRNKIIGLLEDFEKSSDRQMEKFMKIAEREIKCTLETCTDAISDIESSLETLRSVTKQNVPLDMFIMTQKALGQKESYAIALADALKHTKDMYIDIVPQTNIQNLEALNNIGEMHFAAEEVQFSEELVSSVSKLPKSEVRSPRTVKDVFERSTSVSPRPPTLHGSYSVRLADDKATCENAGTAFLPDGRVAIADMKNNKVKVFDTKFRQGMCLRLSSGPRGLAVVSPQEVAVSLPDESKIQFVSVTKKLKATRSILTDIPCYGITCYNSELVVLCDDGFSTTAIQVLDLEGEVKRTIKVNKTGKVALKNPWSLTLNPDGQQICVTDRGRLVCMDISGSVIFEYTDQNLDNARGVTIDDLGRFYVCGTSSNNVHQVSPDGTKVSIILGEGDISAPQSVCFYAEKRLLLVASVGNDTVSIYKLKHS